MKKLFVIILVVTLANFAHAALSMSASGPGVTHTGGNNYQIDEGTIAAVDVISSTGSDSGILSLTNCPTFATFVNLPPGAYNGAVIGSPSNCDIDFMNFGGGSGIQVSADVQANGTDTQTFSVELYDGGFSLIDQLNFTIVHVQPLTITYNADTYAYAHAAVDHDADSGTDTDTSSNSSCTSLVSAHSLYAEGDCMDDSLYFETQDSSVDVGVDVQLNSNGASLISDIYGWGEWYWYDCYGSDSGDDGGDGNGNATLTGTITMRIPNGFLQDSPGLRLAGIALITGSAPAGWDTYSWYLKIWDTDPASPLMLLNASQPSAQLSVLAGQVLNFEFYNEAFVDESTEWPSGGLNTNVTVDLTLDVPGTADIDGDGKVTIADFAILASQFEDVPGTPSADIAPEIRDNFVDFQDLQLLALSWMYVE
ncbi:MAG TPA: hypothetical protein ENH94_04770 [Phycisphaerales bacterium]|nr:hypothetical protein [Phycisphaerales bacterium]